MSYKLSLRMVFKSSGSESIQNKSLKELMEDLNSQGMLPKAKAKYALARRGFFLFAGQIHEVNHPPFETYEDLKEFAEKFNEDFNHYMDTY
jgi:hypothetical protein